MGDSTAIAWADRTWNPWQGCHKVAQGCKHCYMHRDKRRYGQDPGTVIRSAPVTFNRPLSKTWSTPGRVFVCSWSDFWIDEADGWRDEAFDVIRRAPHLTYQIPSKRVARINGGLLPSDWGAGWSNVWLGASASTGDELWEQAIELIQIPARVRWLSLEPLIEDVSRHLHAVLAKDADKIHWIVVGGESGPDARPCNTEWIRRVVEACRLYAVPVFVKQLGAHCIDNPGGRATAIDHLIKGGWRRHVKGAGADLDDFPEDLRVREYPEEAPRRG